MAAGEYVSVSSQSDLETADLRREEQELIDFPVQEEKELAKIYVNRGLTKDLADSSSSRAHRLRRTWSTRQRRARYQ